MWWWILVPFFFFLVVSLELYKTYLSIFCLSRKTVLYGTSSVLIRGNKCPHKSLQWWLDCLGSTLQLRYSQTHGQMGYNIAFSKTGENSLLMWFFTKNKGNLIPCPFLLLFVSVLVPCEVSAQTNFTLLLIF